MKILKIIAKVMLAATTAFCAMGAIFVDETGGKIFFSVIAGISVVCFSALSVHPSHKRQRCSSKIYVPTENNTAKLKSDTVTPHKAPDFRVDLKLEDKEKSSTDIELENITNSQALHIHDYIVLDVETTGLNKQRDKIVEIAWAEYKKGEKVSEFSTLVNPEFAISPAASKINHISDSDVANSPKYADIKDRVQQALVGATIVGHNIQFDLAFVTKLLNDVNGKIKYIDTTKLAREAFPGQKSYKLEQLCVSLELPYQSTHRAIDDVYATNELFVKCQHTIVERKNAEKAQRKAEKEREQAQRLALYGASPLFDISFVYTGAFSVSREEMQNMAISVGGLVRQAVSGKTDYLVVGNLDNFPEWALKRKLKKAEQIQTDGGKIKIIDEAKYFELISSAK